MEILEENSENALLEPCGAAPDPLHSPTHSGQGLEGSVCPELVLQLTPSLATPPDRHQQPNASGQEPESKCSQPSGKVHMTEDQRFSNADPAAKNNGLRIASRKV